MQGSSQCATEPGAAAGAQPSGTRQTTSPSGDPSVVLDPVEVSGAEAVPVMGRLPGARRMYVLPAEAGEHHLIGAQVMTRAARPADTGNVYELMMFTGLTGASMPRHLHRASHAALLVLGGDVELELDGRTWRMLRGDFANIPPGTPHAWTMRSDRSKIALYTVNDRVGAAFVAMGVPHGSATPPSGAAPGDRREPAGGRRVPGRLHARARARGRGRAGARGEPDAALRRLARTSFSTAAARNTAATRSSRGTRTRRATSCSS